MNELHAYNFMLEDSWNSRNNIRQRKIILLKCIALKNTTIILQ